jgi:hypothetical protein
MTSTLLSQIASSPTAANQFVTDLNQLAQNLQSGNLSAAQQDYVTLSQDALSGVTSTTSTTSASGITPSLFSDIASSSSSANSFVSEFNQLGTDLTNGNLASADSDMLSLDSTALNAVPSSSANASSSSSNKADIAALIQATTQAMEVGDDSAVGADMSQLASVSTSSTGAGYLQTDSANYGSGSGSVSGSGSGSGGSSSSSSVAQLLQSVNTDSSSSAGSSLSLFA